MESLQIKNKYYYDCGNIIIYDFDFDIGLVKIFKRESKIGVNIYYIGYKPDIDDTITPLHLFVDSDLYLPLDTLIEFHSLIINVSCVIEKDNEYYPEIYLDGCLYSKI